MKLSFPSVSWGNNTGMGSPNTFGKGGNLGHVPLCLTQYQMTSPAQMTVIRMMGRMYTTSSLSDPVRQFIEKS